MGPVELKDTNTPIEADSGCALRLLISSGVLIEIEAVVLA